VTFVLLLIDLDTKRLPNSVLLSGGGVATGLLVAGSVLDGNAGALSRALLAAAVYFGILLVIALVSRGGMGMGDVKLGALLGLFTGYLSWAVFAGGVISAFILGGLAGLALLASGRKRTDDVPFGPALVAGAWLAILAEPLLADILPSLAG
jgi:leader peptidase (prepilin peptidase)/N-methyltransferase